ncbi:HTH domain-containing protein [Niameybacter massiliensis]|uniref:HTH domain-containing protein n=1 Tax=Holtiella tumoricola TaxID=3018743 RepID=A0AA42DLU4_9FIRM|nr:MULTISPECIES: HTH domain-containing protein [Lachnospirales]MDA3731331.1 HTH domain-containing protein [Holtiella tumoricola]
MEAKDKVLNLLKENNEPMKAGEIAESLGVDKKEVDKAIKELKAEELIGSPKRCYYAAN